MVHQNLSGLRSSLDTTLFPGTSRETRATTKNSWSLYPSLPNSRKKQLDTSPRLLAYSTMVRLQSPFGHYCLVLNCNLARLILTLPLFLVDVYTGIMTASCSVASVARRESPCSHTTLLEPGTVLTLPDMRIDERFSNSPQVQKFGMISYAGTPLTYTVPESG